MAFFVKTDKVQDFYVCNIVIPAIVLTLIAFILIVFKSIIWVIVMGCLYMTSAFYGLHILQYISMILVKCNAICGTLKPMYEAKEPCRVCNSNDCKRHKLLPHSTKVKIPKDFDHALEQMNPIFVLWRNENDTFPGAVQDRKRVYSLKRDSTEFFTYFPIDAYNFCSQLLEDVLKKYVCAWYSDFSTNEAFVQQLRLATATATKNLVVRLLRTNVANVVFCQLIPLLLQHSQDWKVLSANSQKSYNAIHFRDHVIKYLGHEIHPAAYSRRAELNYLRGLVIAILPHLLPAVHVSTNNKVILREILSNWILLPAIDAIADPENINTLIMLTTHQDTTMSNHVDTLNVQMLQCWMTNMVTPNFAYNHLKPSLDEILNDARLLYMFIQHVKETGPMNLLQFCLDIDDLSKRMLNPEISADAENSLYIDIQNMYSMYLDPDGPEYLHLPKEISMGIQQVLEKSSKKIEELRTSRPFYQAHQEAHALLESTCLTSFHHSYQLYALLCGCPTASRTKQSSRASVVSGSANVSAKIGNHFQKIEGILRASTIDGMAYQDIYQGEEIDYPLRSYNEIKCPNNAFPRDLTTWRVSIPHTESGDTQPLHMISVHNVAEGKSWTVLRRDQDFYALRTRLIEFHGEKELSDSPLPSRKNPPSSHTLNSQRYEDFLDKLLSKPVLRSSELLYNFLTMPNLKPYFTNYSTPDIGILYQNVAYKLRKEKGQNLDKFMTTFLASTNVKNDYTDVAIELLSEMDDGKTEEKGHRDLSDGVFGDNLNVDADLQKTLPFPSAKRSHVKGTCFCVADAVDKLLNVPSMVMRAVWMFAFSTRTKVDPLVNILLYNGLTRILNSGRAAAVINLLHTKAVGDKNRMKEKFSQGNCENCCETAKKALYGLLPYWLIGFYRPWTEVMDSVVNSLQNAQLNKHIAYILLDQIVISLFPELVL